MNRYFPHCDNPCIIQPVKGVESTYLSQHGIQVKKKSFGVVVPTWKEKKKKILEISEIFAISLMSNCISFTNFTTPLLYTHKAVTHFIQSEIGTGLVFDPTSEWNFLLNSCSHSLILMAFFLPLNGLGTVHTHSYLFILLLNFLFWPIRFF